MSLDVVGGSWTDMFTQHSRLRGVRKTGREKGHVSESWTDSTG